jgi:hypothetical protein
MFETFHENVAALRTRVRFPVIRRVLAKVVAYFLVIHLVLVVVGYHESNLKVNQPMCPGMSYATTACVIHVQDDLWLASVAWSTGITLWDIVSDNPTLPLFWPVPSGRDIYVTRRDPTSMSDF